MEGRLSAFPNFGGKRSISSGGFWLLVLAISGHEKNFPELLEEMMLLLSSPFKSPMVICLVVSNPLKNISQNGNLPQIGVKIENI